MKITTRCSVCGQKIRFPVNRGKIRVSCPNCNSRFIFNPSLKEVLRLTKRLCISGFDRLRKLNLTTPEGFYRFKTEVERKITAIYYSIINIKRLSARRKIIIISIVLAVFIILYRGCSHDLSRELDPSPNKGKKITI